MSLLEKTGNAALGAFGVVVLAFAAANGIDHLTHPEKAAARRAVEVAEEAAEKAETETREAERAATKQAKAVEEEREARLERELSDATAALMEARSHYPQTDVEVPEYERYWKPREIAAKQRYERAVLAARGRTAAEVEAQASAEVWAASPYNPANRR